MRHIKIICGDALEVLKGLPDTSIQCCVTSPPFFSTLDFTITGQLGMESTPGKYIERLTTIFHEVRRILDAKGTLFLNLADEIISQYVTHALEQDGWYVKTVIQWKKPHPPDEVIVVFTIREEVERPVSLEENEVWTFPAGKVFSGHYASFPLTLPTRCIELGCLPQSTILDPFSGAGTTGLAATRLGHHAVLIDINPQAVELSQTRIKNDEPFLNDVQIISKETL
jgi:DNA modification methylase